MRLRRHILILIALAILPGALTAQTNVSAPAAKSVSVFEVKAYRFEGVTFLPPEKLSGALSNYTGTVNLARVRAGLNRLQQLYRQSGYTNISVTIPQQTMSDGVILVKIISRAPASAAATVTNTAAKPPPTLAIKTYRIEGNTVLSPQDFGVLSNYTGTNITFPYLREGLGKVQLRYRELGFPTISVTLPQQRITNGAVRIKVVEGRIGAIRVTGNEYFSSNNVRRALPSLTTNILLNTKWFQPELDAANQNRDRQIYPVIEPGFEPGTSDLTLKVKDRDPVHGRIEINDKSAPGTALLRSDTAIQYGNLWQLEHQIGFDYNFSPQEYKSADDANHFPPDLPQVATFSGFYRLPLGGGGGGLREDYDQKPATFGYDEVSHKFNLPPPSGHPDLIIYGSHSSSDTSLQYGPLKTIYNTNIIDITQQDVSHSPTINDDVGTKLTLPLAAFAGIKSAVSFGLDWKSYSANTYYTNLTYVNLYAADPQGNRIYPAVTNITVPLAANSSQSLFYLPLAFGWAAVRPDKTGSFQFTINDALFIRDLGSNRKNFQQVAGNAEAGGTYTTINSGLIRQQNLPGDWSIVANANGQWASEPLISNEQFGLGGTAGVRGYQEGEVYGDTGWRTLLDLRAPPVNVGYFPTATGEVPAMLRCSCFMDYGKVYFINRPGQVAVSEWGTGFGFFLTAGEHFDARLTIAWALLGAGSIPTGTASYVNVKTAADSAQAYFSVGYQF
jgi:hemolysin activation/secretion protein